MLKNVVLPAPLGPINDTIECSGTSNEYVVDRHEAAELLGHVVGLASPRSWLRPGGSVRRRCMLNPVAS